MAQQLTTYRCLIISPSDVEDARDEVERVISEWNAHVGRHLGARVEAVRWETHSFPELGAAPQTLLNRQLVDSCDLGVAIFWSRLGTPTRDHESGSIEEIERLTAAGAPVSIYFCSAEAGQGERDPVQTARLREIRERYMARGMIGSYSTAKELGKAFLLHLTSIVSSRLAVDSSLKTTNGSAPMSFMALARQMARDLPPRIIPDEKIIHELSEEAKVTVWMRRGNGAHYRQSVWLPAGWWVAGPRALGEPQRAHQSPGVLEWIRSLLRPAGTLVPADDRPYMLARRASLRIFARGPDGRRYPTRVVAYPGWWAVGGAIVDGSADAAAEQPSPPPAP